ncbi:MAG: ABC transporter ATP-binding protein [Pedosphaera sp.]|nr:ABC transporter ATP-binding protein [Pedosphaera sp.]
MNNLFRALQFFRPDLGRVSFAFGLLILSTGANLLKPWPLALIVDNVLGGKPFPPWFVGASDWDKNVLLLSLSGAILLFHASQGALSAWHNYLSITVGLHGLARVRNQVFYWLQRLSLRFHQSSNLGDVIYRASWDTYAFQTLFQQGLFTFAQASLALVLMMIVMWRLNVSLTLASLATIPMLLFTMKIFGREMKTRSLAAHKADSQVTSLIQQSMVALPLIQSYTREEDEQKRFARQAGTALEGRISQHGWEVFYWLVIAFVVGLGTAGVTWVGASEVLAQQLSVGELLIFLAYLAQLYEPLNQLSRLRATWSDASAGTQRVFELLDTEEEIKEASNARPVGKNTDRAAHIEFDRVSFGYQEHRLVLHDIGFSVPVGQSVAIIGPSGSGKTTLLQLLTRFYDPTSGSVRLNGIDLRELRLKDLRSNISLVLQEPILLPATIAENIAYGKPGASRREIEAAARSANADEFIRNLPDHYETAVGEGAARLSVGEKQRINLARAFLKDAPILVLDEPTSALDAESEALVVASLAELIQSRTTLLVAHRLSTIRQVDRILVVENGCVTQMGTREELIRQEGYYARVAR